MQGVIFDIPSTVNARPENVSRQEKFMAWRRTKKTSGHYGYDGPRPPSAMNRYYFKLYALDKMLNLKPGLTKEGLLAAMKGHVLAETQIKGQT